MKIRIVDIIILIIFLILSFIIISTRIISKKDNNILLINTEKENFKYSLNENRTIVVNGKIGITIIEINNGRFRFVESSCQNKTCVKTGWVSISDYPIICLPNRVSAYIESNEEKDFDVITR
ncbi:MAG TPA: NusG domain II-containing protein [Spirochaetota bacterium]|nr:NusG domain II-containing protein [Spirochaetota bacterium]HOL56990.1 NusG domain II-containing protein [Spirochaetota bacterium]HPP05526.1 NusG domain II-containing protein [Spirochaetota bacterium]